MAQEYFKNFPEMQYTLSDGKIITIKDFFRKSKNTSPTFEKITFFSKKDTLGIVGEK